VDAGAARSKKDTVRAEMLKMLFIYATPTTGWPTDFWVRPERIQAVQS
jgi:hypothetical protein